MKCSEVLLAKLRQKAALRLESQEESRKVFWSRWKRIRLLGLLVGLSYFPLGIWAAPPLFDVISVLRFNTVCANCHEAQCSGRLSFSLSPEASFNHIRRYAGEADPVLLRQLKALLEYMKRECAYAPLPALDLHEPIEQEVLEAYRDPASGHYFIPLGVLKTGTYHLRLYLETPGTLRVEVLNASFEFLIDECFACDRTIPPLTMEVEEASAHYLRLRSADRLRLKSLRLGEKN